MIILWTSLSHWFQHIPRVSNTVIYVFDANIISMQILTVAAFKAGVNNEPACKLIIFFFSPHPKPLLPICNSFALSPHRSLTLPEKTRKQDPRSGNVAYRWFRQLLLSPLKPSSCLCSIFNITAKGWVISEGGTKKIEHGFIRKLWLCIYAITDDRYIQ